MAVALPTMPKPSVGLARQRVSKKMKLQTRLDRLVASMEVQVNRLEEERREREIYEQGVRAMRLAGNQESN